MWDIGDTDSVEEFATTRPNPSPGQVIRRTIAVFFGTAAVIGFVWYIFDGTLASSRCIMTLHASFGGHAGGPCDEVKAGGGVLVFYLIIAAISVILWTAPWQRFLGGRARARTARGSLDLRRRMTQAFGIVLVGLGAGVIVSSLAGSFAGDSECGWYELWCSDPDGFFPRGFIDPIREAPFALSRIVGIGFGAAAIGWGVTEIRSSGRGVRWLMVRLLGGAGLIGVLAFGLRDPLGYGWPGFVLSVLFVAAAVGITRRPHHGTTIPSLTTLFVTMALAIGFGAWLQWELQGALSLAVPAVAAGGYLSYVRWKVRAPGLTDDRGEAAYQVWSQEHAAERAAAPPR